MAELVPRIAKKYEIHEDPATDAVMRATLTYAVELYTAHTSMSDDDHMLYFHVSCLIMGVNEQIAVCNGDYDEEGGGESDEPLEPNLPLN